MSQELRPLRNDAALAIAILFIGCLLVVVGGPWPRIKAVPIDALTFDQLFGLGANLAGLAVVSWWLLSFVLGLMANVLKRTGQSTAARVASKATPAFMIRIGAAVLSVNLLRRHRGLRRFCSRSGVEKHVHSTVTRCRLDEDRPERDTRVEAEGSNHRPGFTQSAFCTRGNATSFGR
ncbi:hypothetical protein A5N17_11430 [Arthrobacter sp. D2]|nr:hypothetical protein [Arthrobacter sp. M5]NKR16935.1 hypothetical protein [Arthrobacter sp. M6]OEH62654.1 hypothetical protein A5N13_03190 [Arthrobacter sp. D4]OEH63225.1 hypothetical protein A5N17_11430 [Arthrobacter sp. D2]